MVRLNALPPRIGFIVVSSIVFAGLGGAGFPGLGGEAQAVGANITAIVSNLLLNAPEEGEACHDADGDGYGSPASPTCLYPEEDCDDTNEFVHPGAVEGPFAEPAVGVCTDTWDNDCDGYVDEGEPGCCFDFQGGLYEFKLRTIPLVTQGISQNPLGCLINPVFLGVLVGMMQDYGMLVSLPPYSPNPFVFTLPLPMGLGALALDDTRFGPNELAFGLEPASLVSLDLGPVQDYLQTMFPTITGFNCLLTADTVEGGLESLNGATLPGDIYISGWTVDTGSGEGACSSQVVVPEPAETCTVRLTIGGTFYSPP